jgi:beta-glucanase (GH16 family)
MINLRILFGLVPKTAEYEAKQDSLRQEYLELITFSQSKELADYIELEKTVNSSDFKLKKKNIKNQRFSDTPEFTKEREYLRLKRGKDIQQYYKTKDSIALKDFLEFDQSYDLKHYTTLEKFVQSDQFLKAKEYAKLSPKERFRRSDLNKSLQQYLDQKSASHIRDYYKVQNLKAFHDYNRLINSETLRTFETLKEYVNSAAFTSQRRSMKKSEFRNSVDYQKLQQYNYLRKSSEIKNYYAIVNSPMFANYTALHGSKEIEDFEALEKLVHSDDFKLQREKLEKHKFENTPEYEKFSELQALKKSQRFRDYFAFKSSKEYLNFTQLIGSEKITGFEQLEKYIQSEDFKKVKEYMLLPGQKKLEMSEEYRMEQKYIELKKSERFQWYFSIRDSKKFDEIKRWQLTFQDEFDLHVLDNNKWLTRYFWGEKMLHDSYVNDAEKQFFTDGKNIEIANSILTIHTKKEKVNGKSWNPAIGFYSRDFEYSSGIINSGAKFRQQYGLFEAKIRFNQNHPVNHAFWMISDLMLPHIDVAKASRKIMVGNYFGNSNVKGGVDKNVFKLSRSRYGSDFQIFSLEWSKDKLVWKINGITIHTANQGVPHTPMFVNFSSSLFQDVNGTILPASMEVDWVRCYKHV